MKQTSWSHLRILVINSIILFSLTGCAIKQLELTESGFLSSYSDLAQDEELRGMRIYKNSDMDIGRRYSSILIAPVEFKLDPTVKEHEMDYKDRIELSNYFHERLLEGLIEKYEIADEPGSGVLLLRMAITDILPNKVYLNLHWSTTLYGAGIGGASLEAELVDSLTGEQVMSFVDARKGKKLKLNKGWTKWGHTQAVLGIWAEVIAANLNQSKEKYAYENDKELYEVEP